MSPVRRGSDVPACDIQETGAVELYFYDELQPAEHERIAAHIVRCAVCRSTLEDLRMIRQALAARPDVSAPAGGDWSGFMGRLDAAIGPAADVRQSVTAFRPPAAAVRSFAGFLAMAALLAIVTIGVVFVARQRSAMPGWQESAASLPVQANRTPIATSGLRSAGARHFERSKLVVLGLAGRESEAANPSEWAYERQLATSLLNDTRLYRIAAEERGLTALAGIMRDLELVLLETSMAEETDGAALEQIQRLIRKRGLIEKMDTVASAGM